MRIAFASTACWRVPSRARQQAVFFLLHYVARSRSYSSRKDCQMKSAVTVSLVQEARGGPFVFWDDLDQAFATAAELGFDAIEIFAPGPNEVNTQRILQLCSEYDLKIAAVGTGAGMVKHGLSLTDGDATKRRQAQRFIADMINFGAELNAPAIIGSMQGRWSSQVSLQQALDWLVESLTQLGQHAGQAGQPLLYEPLNRYETNLARTLDEGRQLLDRIAGSNVKLLADLFHMNIEESRIDEAIQRAGTMIGHVHFVDSNRLAAGMGHMDFAPIIQSLHDVGYHGYLSAEAFALPDSYSAAKSTIQTYRSLLHSKL